MPYAVSELEPVRSALIVVTTENCCHATARDALFHDCEVVFLSNATGTFDYPDVGQGAMSAEEVHRASLVILCVSTAGVMTVDELVKPTHRTPLAQGSLRLRLKRCQTAPATIHRSRPCNVAR